MANYQSPNLDNGEKEEGKKKIRPKETHEALIAVHRWTFVFYFVVILLYISLKQIVMLNLVQHLSAVRGWQRLAVRS